MKKTQPWHHTRLGAVAGFLGSIQMAVPVLILVAAALAWGTYLESTAGTKVARALVYGSWWFIGLMVLICVSLVFAVVTRYPWKLRHVGFITVHASLILMIIAGFWSLFGRVEGHLPLEEGTSNNVIETDDERLELLQHGDGQFTTLAETPATGSAALTLDGISVRVVERWDNTREEPYVADDGPEPFRAIEVSFDAASGSEWIGEESKSGGVTTLRGLRIRVLPDGATWEPGVKPEVLSPGYAFVVGQERYPVGEEGQDAFPGWKITSIRRLSRAVVSAAGLSESDSGDANPALDVTISNGRGTTERHTAFLNFPDMVMSKAVEGTSQSGARLTATPPSGALETLIVYGAVSAPFAGYIAPDGAARRVDGPHGFPWTLDLGSRRVTVVRQLTHARPATRFVKAPTATDHRPALLVRVADATELTVVPWKDLTPVSSSGRQLLLRYGPRLVALPFTVRLEQFRKTDYPGTDMAMAYESDVGITLPAGGEQPFRIFMNHPYAHASWRVYQSGFIGEHISIFSVMRDPGLHLTYAGAIGLCVGILLTFYSRSLSWGHPGIPIEFASTTPEPIHAATPPRDHRAVRAVPVDQPAGAGSI